MFKELDTIYLIDENNEKIVLATREGLRWVCRLCDENENYRTKMLDHVRFTHIRVE